LEFRPYEYQVKAVRYIATRPASALFLECGLGKTVITLTAVKLLKKRGAIKKALVIAPLRVAAYSWPEEIKKWNHLAGLSYSLVLGAQSRRLSALKQEADIYIINRENATWLVETLDKDWDFDCVIADELSSFKSSKSKRFRALKKIRSKIARFIGLTGTPAPNGLADLWPQIYLLDMGKRLGKTKTAFEERYFNKVFHPSGSFYDLYAKEGAEAEIYEAVGDICASMKAEDYLDLPPRIDNVIKIQLELPVLQAYKRFEREKILKLYRDENEITAANAAVLVNKLLQFSNGAVYDENGNHNVIHNSKIEALRELADVSAGAPILVFYSFRSDYERITKELAEFKPRAIKTGRDIDDWNAGRIPLALTHPAATGHGLNLQYGGNIIVWFSLPWSLELYAQANARLRRQGQRKTVIINHLIASETADEDVLTALTGKGKMQDALMIALKAKAGSPTDFRSGEA
jgi:SNF2 family DNA or RNA helicase